MAQLKNEMKKPAVLAHLDDQEKYYTEIKEKTEVQIFVPDGPKLNEEQYVKIFPTSQKDGGAAPRFPEPKSNYSSIKYGSTPLHNAVNTDSGLVDEDTNHVMPSYCTQAQFASGQDIGSFVINSPSNVHSDPNESSFSENNSLRSSINESLEPDVENEEDVLEFSVSFEEFHKADGIEIVNFPSSATDNELNDCIVVHDSTVMELEAVLAIHNEPFIIGGRKSHYEDWVNTDNETVVYSDDTYICNLESDMDELHMHDLKESNLNELEESDLWDIEESDSSMDLVRNLPLEPITDTVVYKDADAKIVKQKTDLKGLFAAFFDWVNINEETVINSDDTCICNLESDEFCIHNLKESEVEECLEESDASVDLGNPPFEPITDSVVCEDVGITIVNQKTNLKKVKNYWETLCYGIHNMLVKFLNKHECKMMNRKEESSLLKGLRSGLLAIG